MKHLVVDALIGMLSLFILIGQGIHVDRQNYENLQTMVSSLQQAGMPDSQIKALRATFSDVSRHAFSLANTSGFLGIVIGMNALIIAGTALDYYRKKTGSGES